MKRRALYEEILVHLELEAERRTELARIVACQQFGNITLVKEVLVICGDMVGSSL